MQRIGVCNKCCEKENGRTGVINSINLRKNIGKFSERPWMPMKVTGASSGGARGDQSEQRLARSAGT